MMPYDRIQHIRVFFACHKFAKMGKTCSIFNLRKSFFWDFENFFSKIICDIICSYSIFFKLKEIAKLAKLDHHEIYRIYGYMKRLLSWSYFTKSEAYGLNQVENTWLYVVINSCDENIQHMSIEILPLEPNYLISTLFIYLQH